MADMVEMKTLTIGGIVFEVADSKSRSDIKKITTSTRISEIVLMANKWVAVNERRHSQVVDIPNITQNSQVDITLSAEQFDVFHQKDVSFVAENEDGIVTVYVIGQKPQNNYTVQVTITEVAYE